MFKNIILLFSTLILFIILVRYIEKRSIFFPTRDFSYTPDSFNLKYEEVNFNTEDNVEINAWFIPLNQPKDSKGRLIVLFSHGNGGNISHRITKIAMLNQLGLNVFIYDYRGYGKSKGKPSEQGIYLDTRAAYDYLVKEKKISTDNIIAYGESLGAAASVDLAAKVKLKALILEGAFSSAKDMAKEIYPFIPSFIIRSKFDLLSKIKNIAIPKFFIHSENDEIVPFELGKKLYNAAKPPKALAVIEGGHNTAFIDSQNKFAESISIFLDNLIRDEK